ncbi:unnamed protein product, partial [Polarella glacialis]
DPAFRGAEAVIDEVAVLEEALREAVARRRSSGAHLSGPPRPSSGVGDFSSPGSAKGSQRFDTAVATYGVQLRAWVDLQVDARLAQVLPGLLEGELCAARADYALAAEASEATSLRADAVA